MSGFILHIFTGLGLSLVLPLVVFIVLSLMLTIISGK